MPLFMNVHNQNEELTTDPLVSSSTSPPGQWSSWSRGPEHNRRVSSVKSSKTPGQPSPIPPSRSDARRRTNLVICWSPRPFSVSA